MLELHPYLNPQYNQASNLSSSNGLNFKNQNTYINFPHHIFNDIFETSTLNKEKNTFLNYWLLPIKDSVHFKVPLEVGRRFLWNT